jgi:hypothetical protein
VRRQFLNSTKGRFVGLAAVSAAVVATQLASTGPAVASSAAEPTTVTVHDTVIAAGSAGVVNFTTSSDDGPWAVSIDLRDAGFRGSRDMVSWDESMCVFYLEYLTCTPTAGQFHIYLHIPEDAPAGGAVLVTARHAGAGDTGVVTVGAPES